MILRPGEMNNIEVHNFLQDHNFTKSCARPPAIGEENEVVSVDGRLSTHSSVSGKSEVSTATPRRNDVDLGFEPEGSASPMIPCERWKLSLQNVLEDSEGLRLFKQFLAKTNQESLLDCLFACKGFREFGKKINCANASPGAASPAGAGGTQKAVIDRESQKQRGKLAKKIFKEFLKKEKCFAVASIVEDGTRQFICRQIKKASQSQSVESPGFELGTNLFDKAQSEIEHYIETDLYASFLKSDLFINCVMQHENKHTKQPTLVSTASNQNGSADTSSLPQNVAQANLPQTGRYLPRLDEDRVWDPPNIRVRSGGEDPTPSINSRVNPVSQSSLARTAMERNMMANNSKSQGTIAGSDQSNPAYPYYVAPSATYYVPPASANASDNASSDATSDTLSITDGSIDFEGSSTYNAKKHQKRIVRHQAKRNHHHSLYNTAEDFFVPITKRCQFNKQNMATLATDHPKEFFSQLKEKLDKVADERRRNEIIEASILDNEDDILNNHIERVMKTPNPMESPSSSPPPVGITAFYPPTKGQNLPILPPYEVNYKKSFRSHIPPQHAHKTLHTDGSRRVEAIRSRREATVAVAPNEVPDIPEVSAQPVDKNLFINEWVKQQGNIVPQSPQPKRGGIPNKAKYINPRDNFPQSTANKARPYHGRTRIQPTAEDMLMPPLPRPDPWTMLDEVKRRLIEETESEYDPRLNLSAPVVNAMPLASSQSMSELRHGAPLQRRQVTATSTTDLENTATIDEQTSSLRASQTLNVKTTCIYKLANESMPYKIHIPGDKITLEHFKNSIRRKGNFKYYFKQYSKEVDGPVYFEVKNNEEILPLWENNVVAKIEDDNV